LVVLVDATAELVAAAGLTGPPNRWKEITMRMESRPDSDYTRTWSPSGEIEYAKLAGGTRLRYLKTGSGPTPLILLHTVRTQLDHFQFEPTPAPANPRNGGVEKALLAAGIPAYPR
jgi:hypothetical protein